MQNEITCTLGVIAESIIIDEHSKNVSIINLIEQINLSMVPSLLNKLTILHKIIRPPDVKESNFELSLNIRNNDKQIFTGKIFVDFLENRKFRSVTSLVGLVVFEIGELMIEIKYKDSTIHEIRIPIEYQKPPEIIHAE